MGIGKCASLFSESLVSSTYIMNCFDKQFFPQFMISGNLLHVWVIFHGSNEEATFYEAFVSFYINNECCFTSNDKVQPISRDKKLFTTGQLGLAFPMKKLTEYFDVATNDYAYQDSIEFQLQISCKKINELGDNDDDGYGSNGDCKFRFKSENCYTCRY